MSYPDGPVPLTPEVVEMACALATELRYGHNPYAYLCAERPDGQECGPGELCIVCADGVEAMRWKMRALRAEAELKQLGR